MTLENGETEDNLTYEWTLEAVPYEALIEWAEENYEIEGFTRTETATEGELTVSTEGNVIEVTNEYERNTFEVTVTKEFIGIPAELLPESFQISVEVDGKEVQVLKLTDKDVQVEGLKYTWVLTEEIPFEAEVTATESGMDVFGFTLSESAVTEVTITVDLEGNILELTNPYTVNTFNVVVNKEWDDGNNNDGFRDDLGATVQLFKQLEGETEKTKVGDPVTVGLGDDWSYTWKDLPAYENGKLVTYSVEETYANDTIGYEKEISGPVKYQGNESEEINVTNTYQTEKITVKVEKSWVGDEDFDVRPDKITVNLLADGEKAGSVELSENNEWKYEFTDLNKYKDGKEIEYTVNEILETAGYTKEITGDQEEGYTIINTFTPIKYDPPVIKEVTGEGADPNDTFTFKFERVTAGAPMPNDEDADEMTATIKAKVVYEFGWMYLTKPGVYEYKITEVKGSNPQYKYDETEYNLKFTVKADENNQLTCELTVNGTKVDFESQDAYQFKFVNEFRENITVEVEKIWVDNDNAEGKRPDSIDVTLYADGEAVETVTLSKDNEWKHVFDELPAVNDKFEEIQYTVEEDKVPDGYKSTTARSDNKFTITNTIETPETGDASNMVLWLSLFGASMSGTLGAAYVALKKKKEQE